MRFLEILRQETFPVPVYFYGIVYRVLPSFTHKQTFMTQSRTITAQY